MKWKNRIRENCTNHLLYSMLPNCLFHHNFLRSTVGAAHVSPLLILYSYSFVIFQIKIHNMGMAWFLNNINSWDELKKLCNEERVQIFREAIWSLDTSWSFLRESYCQSDNVTSWTFFIHLFVSMGNKERNSNE